jgi:hypothetical protein
MKPDTHALLCEDYGAEIARMESVLGRDLASWHR